MVNSTPDDGLKPIQIYSTESRRTEPFETREPGTVSMYVCGVTVYDSAHIGHAMSLIVFDVIRRYLEHRGYRVTHAQNFTDVDDKIIARARAQGVEPNELTERLIAEWGRQTHALNVLPANIYPRATQEMASIIAIIEGLIERGMAYEVGGDVYFRVREFAGYGKLSHRNPDDLRSGARIEIDERKEDPLDFALWKAAKPGEPTWRSPWSDGRPGWHIECSAMCLTHLGAQIDIHGGGADLIFPHHENEIAQSEAYLGTEPFALYWVHNGLLRFDNEKMSKSLGNLVPVGDLLARGLGPAFRLMVLQSNYRAPLTYSDDGLLAAERGLDRLRAAAGADFAHGDGGGTSEAPGLDSLAGDVNRRFHDAMSDDFDTPAAVAALFDLGRAINRARTDGQRSPAVERARLKLLELSGILGLELNRESGRDAGSADPFIDLLVSLRDRLRSEKQWSLSDHIRDELTERGISIEDGAAGSIWSRRKS